MQNPGRQFITVKNALYEPGLITSKESLLLDTRESFTQTHRAAIILDVGTCQGSDFGSIDYERFNEQARNGQHFYGPNVTVYDSVKLNLTNLSLAGAGPAALGLGQGSIWRIELDNLGEACPLLVHAYFSRTSVAFHDPATINSNLYGGKYIGMRRIHFKRTDPTPGANPEDIYQNWFGLKPAGNTNRSDAAWDPARAYLYKVVFQLLEKMSYLNRISKTTRRRRSIRSHSPEF